MDDLETNLIDDRASKRRDYAHHYLSQKPAVVAITMAFFHDVPCFPTHGIIRSATGEFECSCHPYYRKLAQKNGEAFLPCQNPGKQPGLQDWPNKATTDPHLLLHWAKSRPSANFSAVTGSKSGLWVLDVDGEEGIASFNRLVEEWGIIPPTPMTQSGRGNGYHYWFKSTKGVIVRNSQGQIAPGIDVRGENGQILLPGSLHKSGNRYRWLDGSAPFQLEMVEAPDNWVRLALEACKKTASGSAQVKNTGSRQRGKNQATVIHDSSLVIGDGEGRGGFHTPINGNAVKYFFRFGLDADKAALKEALKRAVHSAPCHNHDAHRISRYMSDQYLDEAIESAWNYVRGVKMAE